MRSFFAALSLALYAISALGAVTPALHQVKKFSGQVKPNSYIIKLKEGASKDSVHSLLGSHAETITHDYDSSFYHGFAGVFGADALNTLRSSADIEYITEDGIMSTFDTQTDASWSLGRISTKSKLSNQDTSAFTYTYTYNSNPGAGVDVYVVDTGIYTDHPEFEGRASWGKTFGNNPDADGNGHGTHVAGSVGSVHYGVAKAVSLIAVKVLGDDGSGATSDIISGLQWVQSQAQSSGRPSIATMSLGGGFSQSMNDATTSLVNAGIHVTVAAGNSNTDAGNTSPASSPGAITVGASTIADTRASYSNYGSVVAIFGPGSDITSTWNDGSTNKISGTSMATPHVAGLVAYFISTNGNMSPSAMRSFVKSHAVKNALSGIPSSTSNAFINNAL